MKDWTSKRRCKWW